MGGTLFVVERTLHQQENTLHVNGRETHESIYWHNISVGEVCCVMILFVHVAGRVHTTPKAVLLENSGNFNTGVEVLVESKEFEIRFLPSDHVAAALS